MVLSNIWEIFWRFSWYLADAIARIPVLRWILSPALGFFKFGITAVQSYDKGSCAEYAANPVVCLHVSSALTQYIIGGVFGNS